jgi:hypothetical protein
MQQRAAMSLIRDSQLARLAADKRYENAELSVSDDVCALRGLRWRLRCFRSHYVSGKRGCVDGQRSALDSVAGMKATKGICIGAVCLALASTATSHADSDKSVTAAQVNGTWRREFGEFKIWALGRQLLQVEFSGVYEYKTPQGLMANEGDGSGIATIEGDTAIFKPEGAEEGCQITLKFTSAKLVVTQTGICGFGHNVSAEGTYRRVSSKKPKFGSD